ncbi:DUF1876 domain-containing protein [Rhodococcus spelaei]|uniref:DUF1876 domain-containing protein n=1 Tax=Rhodococcus spelaei TaxID=2546320 RepID=A0A541BRR6_9NOCA|nr:DUF1876 domain-containing protein [Rhodococcus spelaei]TQF75013.1 DUF1876 domain-containing protein [Rhodococcus spelaei]
MNGAKHWTVTIDIDERDPQTRAEARLERSAPVGMITGEGLARCSPSDGSVPQIGDELAAARALSDLAHKLLEEASEDIQTSTHRPAHLWA